MKSTPEPTPDSPAPREGGVDMCPRARERERRERAHPRVIGAGRSHKC